MAYNNKKNYRNRRMQNVRKASQTRVNNASNIIFPISQTNYSYIPTMNIINGGVSTPSLENSASTPSVFDSILSPDDLMDKVNNSYYEEKQSIYENVFNEENLTDYQKDYNYRHNTTNEGYLKEYDEVINQKINNNTEDILHNKRVEQELKKNSKKYVSKDKQGKVIGDKVDYHKDISKKIIEEEAIAKQQQIRNQDIKEHERIARREQRLDAIEQKKIYKNLFNESDHAEALKMNKEYDEALNLFNESDHAEALKMNEHFDDHSAALKMNETHDYIQSKTIDENIDNAIREAIKNSKEDNIEGIHSSLNKLEREGRIDGNLRAESKKVLTERYDDIYKDIQEQRASLKKTVNKKIVNGNDSYRVNTKNEKMTGTSIKRIAAEESAEQVSKNLKKSAFKNLGHVANSAFAIIDYKDGREAGKSVGGSLIHAGAEFAKGEMLGFWGYTAVSLAKAAPTMAVSAVEGLNTMSRNMNSTQRRQLFGDSQFMDTPQLATMRQSGMELAKMSQYNLQQTLMGNEAEYLHKL